MASGDLIGAPGRQRAAAPAADSRLRSVFLQHRLMCQLPRLPGVPSPTAWFVVGQIVDRLLAVPGGLEPLMLLEREASQLAAGTATAVLAVVLARAAGWPPANLPDLGAAALLAGLGCVLDAEDPARASFRWFLERGTDDFWLRCALVARYASASPAAGLPAQGIEAVALVRLAGAVCFAMQASPRRADWCTGLAAGDGLPAELVSLVPVVFADA